MDFTWKISQLDRRTSDGFITTAHWTCSAKDGEYLASCYGTCGWSDGMPVIPYPEVTEQEVLQWCWDTAEPSTDSKRSSRGCNKDAIEAQLAAQIELQKNPVQATGVPW